MAAALIWHTTSVESSYIFIYNAFLKQGHKSKSFDHIFNHLLPHWPCHISYVVIILRKIIFMAQVKNTVSPIVFCRVF